MTRVNMQRGGVALATEGCQPARVQNRHLAPSVPDQLPLLQLSCGLGDPHASHAEHKGRVAVGHLKSVRMRAVSSH